jgi:UDP-glucose 4-epimerase
MKESFILVVGGAGYIGSHVNKMLHRAGYPTIVLDNLTRGHRGTVRYGTFIEGDLADRTILGDIFETYAIDAVMHFAAYIDVGESVQNPAKYYLNNVVNTFHLLTTMLQYHVKTFIFSSSAAIFGHPLEPFIKEEHPCLPINPYGETKWIVEKMLRHFEVSYGLKYSCLRYFNAAGGDPEGKIKNYQDHPPNLIPRILLSLKKDDGFVTINGTDYPTLDGTCVRDYIHIEDLGHAHITAMKNLFLGFPSRGYNLGSGKGFSVREVIHAVETVLGRKVRVVEGPRRPGDPASLLANSGRAARELNWFPRYTLEAMVEHNWLAYAR